jgi:hypothetical protein
MSGTTGASTVKKGRERKQWLSTGATLLIVAQFSFARQSGCFACLLLLDSTNKPQPPPPKLYLKFPSVCFDDASINKGNAALVYPFPLELSIPSSSLFIPQRALSTPVAFVVPGSNLATQP